MHSPRIRRLEWVTVSAIAVAIMIFVSLPYVVALSVQTDSWRFGGFLIGVVDGNSYLAKMREGATDGWLYYDVYTSEPHDGAFLFTPYLALGKLTALFTSPQSPTFTGAMMIAFHTARIGLGILLILVMYRFIAIFLRRRSLRLLALILATLGGGLGWLLLSIPGGDHFLGTAPIDTILPEGYSFYILQGLPHLALARAALLTGLMLTFHAYHQDRDWIVTMIGAGLCWLVMGLCVPFYVGVVWAILGSWGLAALVRTRRFPTRLFWRCLVGSLVAAPILLYSLYVIAANPVIRQWQAQNVLPSPHPFHYLFGYGSYILFAIFAVRWAWRRSRREIYWLLIVGWLTAAPILAYLPIAVQRRLLEAVFVPLCILTTLGLYLTWFGLRRRLRRSVRRSSLAWRMTGWSWAVILILVLSLPTPLLVSAIVTASVSQRNPQLYNSTSEIMLLDWMNTHLPPNTVVLTDFDIGNDIPAFTSLRVFIGHSPETLYIDDLKRPLMQRFFDGAMNDADQRNLFSTYSIRYVVMTHSQAAALPQLSSALQLLPYNNDQYRIYEVLPDGK
jgi:hypothetical protein